MDQSLISVMKSIGKALQLDSSSDYQEAYIKYAECVLSIVSNLLHKVKSDGDRVIVSKEVVRHVQLGQQCMERLVALVQTIESVQNAASSRATSLQISSNMGARGQGHDQLAKRKHGPSPMELAYFRNQQIMSAYKSRLARMNKGSQATLSLTIQRKMAENLAIAKAQELALSKKMNERQNRLEEQAQRRFSAPMGMSEDEQEQRQIYKKILEYEQDAKWLAKWRFKLESSPEDPIVINQLIQEILRCSDHPLTQLLKKYQYKIYERLYPLVSSKQKLLKDITVPLPLYLFPSDAQIGEGREMEEPTLTGGREKEESENKDKQAEENTSTEGQSDIGGREMEEQEKESEQQTTSEGRETEEQKSSLGREIEQQEKSDISEKGIDVETKNDDQDVLGDKGENSINMPKETKSSQIDDEDEEKEISDVINEVVNKDSPETDSSEEVSDMKTMDDVVEESKENIEKALDKGKKLEKQLTFESERANSIIKQVCEYEKYNEENMDDLFDDEDFEDLGDSDQVVNSSKDRPESFHSLPSMRKPPQDLPKRSTSVHYDLRGDSKHFPKSQSMDGRSTFDPPESSLKSSSSLHSLGSPDGELSKLSEEARKRHLEGISHDIHGYLEKLQLMFVIAYEKLDSPTGRDQCYASLEEPFFKSIWKYILSLFRLVNRTRERTLAYKMTTQQESEPKDFMVSKKLWLVSSDGENRLPYNKAVLELKKVKEYYTMLSKLECVVRVCREVCSCVEEHYTRGDDSSGRKTPPSVGADDLLPILSYIVIRSELPQLVSECQAMSEFIHEGYIMGEEGYCLTSLQTAINYLTSEDTSV